MMKSTLAMLLAAGASVAGASDAFASAWVAKHGLTSAQYQAEFDKLGKQGFRLTDVSGYGGHYAAIWEQKSGPAWTAKHGLTAAQYQSEFDKQAKAGFRLVLVNGYTVSGQDHYAAIWEKKSGPAWVAKHGLTAAQYQSEFDKQAKAGFRLVHVSGFGAGGQDRYAAIWEKKGGPAWVAKHGLTSAQYQSEFDKQAHAGFRLVKVSGYASGGEAHFAAIWEQTPGMPWLARHNLDGANYQIAFDDYLNSDYRLTYVSGYSVGGSDRYAAIWEHNPWQDVVCDNAKCVSISEVSKNIADRLKGKVVGYSSFVGTHGGLVNEYGHSRTSADGAASYTVSSKSPVASVSKQVTALTATKVLAKHNLPADTAIGKYLPPDWKLGKNVAQITFKQLMNHTSGIKNYGNTPNDYADLKAFYAQDVGTDHSGSYSNYNFSIFRIMLPHIDGMAWGSESNRPQRLTDAYVKLAEKNVFEPLGLTNVACKPTGNVPYVFSYAFPGASSGHDWGDDSAGCGAAGWYLSVSDAARVLTSVNQTAMTGQTGILTKAQQKFMESNAQGWDMLSLGNGYRYVEKNGGWSWNGTTISTTIALIGPGVVGVLFMNSEISGEPNVDANAVMQQAYLKALKPKGSFKHAPLKK